MPAHSPSSTFKALDLIDLDRELSRRSFAEFTKLAWHVVEPETPLKWGWALDSICEHLEAVSRGEITRLLINVPPGCMKSLLTSVFWPAWEWGPLNRPALRYISTSHKQDLAVRDSTKCRRLIQSGWYKSPWPIELAGDQNAKTKFENTATGFREAMAFTSLTGSRADRIILDDCHSVDDANSRAKLASDIVTFRESLPSRVNDEHSAIIIICQRLAMGDVSDVALELGYQYLKIPMRYEMGESRHVVGAGDPRTHDGVLMFPERFPESQVVELEASLMAYATAAQLQQRPSARGGTLILGKWFGSYTVPPPLQYRCIYADTAMKTAERHDYSVFECWGKGVDGKIYLLDLIRGKWEAPELERRAIAFWAKHQAVSQEEMGALRQMKVEDKASGTGLIQKLQRLAKIPVVGIERTIDKYTRALDVLGYIESGYVMLHTESSFTADFIAEAEAFTADNSHAHDDMLDCLFDCLNDMIAASRKSMSEVL